MTDTTTLPPGPTPPDAATVERLYENHRRELAYYSETDPNSPCYQRPDLAARYREQLEVSFKDICAAHGVAPPVPKTPAQLAEERFDARWNAEFGERQTALIDEQLEAEAALTPRERELRVEELKRDFGAAGYAQLVKEATAALNPGETMPDVALR